MKPRHALKILDSRRRVLEGYREKLQPGTKKFEWTTAEIAALEHACRLLAFEVTLRSERFENGYPTNGPKLHKDGAFLREVAQGAPQ